MLIDPNACQYCNVSHKNSYSTWHPEIGWHYWVHPTDEQIKARMIERRNRRLGIVKDEPNYEEFVEGYNVSSPTPYATLDTPLLD